MLCTAVRYTFISFLFLFFFPLFICFAIARLLLSYEPLPPCGDLLDFRLARRGVHALLDREGV